MKNIFIVNYVDDEGKRHIAFAMNYSEVKFIIARFTQVTFEVSKCVP